MTPALISLIRGACDTGAQTSMILSRMLSKEARSGQEEGYASLVIRYASRHHFKGLNIYLQNASH